MGPQQKNWWMVQADSFSELSIVSREQAHSQFDRVMTQIYFIPMGSHLGMAQEFLTSTKTTDDLYVDDLKMP